MVSNAKDSSYAEETARRRLPAWRFENLWTSPSSLFPSPLPLAAARTRVSGLGDAQKKRNPHERTSTFTLCNADLPKEIFLFPPAPQPRVWKRAGSFIAASFNGCTVSPPSYFPLILLSMFYGLQCFNNFAGAFVSLKIVRLPSCLFYPFLSCRGRHPRGLFKGSVAVYAHFLPMLRVTRAEISFYR